MTIKHQTHTATVIRERNDILLVEITEDESKKSCGFFVVAWDSIHNQVISVVPGDMPRDGGQWVAPGKTAGSVSYVANGRSRQTALRWFKKLSF